MEHQKYRSRTLVVVAVLLIALYGILPFDRLFNFNLPWRSKLNLKPGIDIRGGISLLYEIKAPPGGATEGLAQRVADALKKRVDPDGVKNLVWRPQGETKLEIQMPLGENSDEAKRLRDQFSAVRKELEATNVRLGEAKAVVAIAQPAERQKEIQVLAMGSPARQAALEKMVAAQARLKAAQAKGDAVAIVDAQDELNKLENALDDTNLPVAKLQGTLDLYQGQIEDARKAKDQAKVDALLKERGEKVAELRGRFTDFPRRLAAMDNFVKSYDAFSRVKGSVDDAEELKRLLRGSGVLEFHILVSDFSSNSDEAIAARAMLERLKKDGPLPRAGDAMRWYEVDQPEEFKGRSQEYAGKQWVLCYITPDKCMVHKDNEQPWGLQDASIGQDPRSGQKAVDFELDARGGVLFGDLSGSNIGKQLGIVLDDKLISAPRLNSRIDNRGQITGSFSDKDLDYLARTLRAGSLPAKLAEEPISERIVSPTLGADNLRAGFTSCMIGLLVVAVFLLGYYYLSGAVAMVAVIMNLIIIVGVLAAFKATFTLPGIAGMVLTLGSAVDANVLIFERLREEQSRGLSLRMALRNAYDRAFSAILDSNVITIITSVVLYIFGSEEVKGFGLTLLIGIASSLFTALFVTRLVFDVMLERFNHKKFGSLPMTFPKWDKLLCPNIDWMGKVWIFVSLSAVILVAGTISFWHEGRNNFDIEFVSGTSVQFELKAPATREQVMSWLEKPQFEKELPGVQAVAVGSGNEVTEYEVVTPNENAKAVRDALMRAIGDKLNIEPDCKFDDDHATVEQAMSAKLVRRADDDAATAFPWAASSIRSHAGGVVIELKNLTPALTVKQIQDRIERARLQPDRANMPYREVDVQVPGDPLQPSSTAVVVVSDEELARLNDDVRWQEELVRPMWQLVSGAISQPASLQKVSNFSAQVARGMMIDAIKALVISVVLVLAYIALRFGNFKYGSATVVAMLHDVVIATGAIGLSHILSHYWFGRHILLLEPFRINLTIVAAVLTVMAYSMVDTIVVFDRIREYRGKYGYLDRNVINDAINHTLSRTLLTCGITLAMIFVMYIFGGPGIHGFTYALLLGILVGTYSSIAIAAPLLLIGGKDVRRAAPAGAKSAPGQLPQARRQTA